MSLINLGGFMSEDVKSKGGIGRKLGVGCAVLIGIIVVLALAGSMMESSEEEQPQATSAASKEVLETTAREIFAAYQENEMRAKQKYDGKLLKVSGTVAGITLDFMDNPVLELESSNEFMPVQASFTKKYADQLASINKGEKALVTCTAITEVGGNPVLDDCTI